ncbi:MAG: helix-turn-helix domain-containing protein [Pseudonocardiales bacterium]|nr:helix-turn-helix domain-containing protein [Pseudonocardiales bacterium]
MTSPAVARRRLGAELRRLRIDADIPVEKAAEALECSPSKISRLETGVGVPRTRDVRDLIDLIGGEADQLRDELLGLAEEGRAQAWYHEFSDVLDSSLERFIDLESGASEELVFGGAWLPGLLQTPEYAEALFRAFDPDMSDDDVRRYVDLRMGRKGVLTRRRGPLRLTAIVDESVLLRAVGDPGVMRGQLGSLRAMAQEPPAGNVEVRLFPFAAGVHELLVADLTVLRFEDDDDVVLSEGHTAQGFEERPAEVESLIATFRSARERTLGGAELGDRLTTLIDRLG